MKRRMGILVVALGVTSMLGFGTMARADCPSPYNGLSCGGVCYDCDSGGTQQVCCDLTSQNDNLFLIEDGAGDPYAYGTTFVGGGGSEVSFCCDGTSLEMNTSSAVYVIIDAGSGNDNICLQDSTAPGCEDRIANLQVWPADSDITAGTGSDVVRTCNSGAYDDYVDAGSGNDTVSTFAGDDTIYGMANDDTLLGGDGIDTIDGGYDIDTIGGGSGDDVLDGSNGVDTINGDADDDVIHGGDNGDYLYGGTGDDDVVGDNGADFIGGDDGDDCLCGGSVGTGTNSDSAIDTLNANASGVNGDACYYESGYPDYDVAVNAAVLCDAVNDSSAADCPCN
jgi:Ca2+-binding RTX toxin-like protein